MANTKTAKRKRIFDIIQIGQREDFPSRVFDMIIVCTIALNIGSMFMQTYEIFSPYMSALKAIESITVLCFCVEYALRIWTADFLYPELEPGKARIKFLFSFDGIVDICTILPFFFLTGFVAFRMLRVVRIFHLFRLNATYDSFNVITKVIYDRRNQLISSMFIIIVLMLASSLGMYSAEHDAQPEVFTNAFSGIWWSVSTILTVGYGDIYPITTLGRIMAIVIAYLGVGVVAVPTGIISAGFVTEYSKMQRDAAEDSARSVATLVVDKESNFEGRAVGTVEDEYNIQIDIIIREGNVILPTNESILKSQDTICYRRLA